MAHFSYTAEKNDGEVYKGVAEANDRFELYQIIRREGAHIISVNEGDDSKKFSLKYWNSIFSTIKEYDKILFARNLGAMLGAGLSLARALSVIERQSKNPKLASTVSELASDVRRGDTLHVALAKYPKVFPKLMVAMVRAGEEGGDLSSSLNVTSDQMERIHDLKKKIRGAMLYPCIILVAILGIGTLMMIKVVPTLASTFIEMNATLPQSTRIVIAISDFLVNNTIGALILIASAVVAMYVLARTAPGQRLADKMFLALPLIGPMVREVNAARTARTLASLSSSGVDVLTSLEITEEVVQNSYFRDVLKIARKSVGEGEPLSATFVRSDALYPAFVGEMMAVGEETGQTAEMLKRLAAYYETEVDRKTKDMSTIIEPFLMLFIGGAVGFFAIAMISPIYQLSEHI
ncbi:MAG: type II secretion system F family protein [Candidatus Pacebacteria bacterium]|nr:type II secretion system F family protein [Candidatus Paceibacterota bacterium]